MLEKTLQSPLDSKEIKPVNPKINQPWIFIGRTDCCWSWSSNTLATWWEKQTHWKRPRCWERLRAGEGDVLQRMRCLDAITDSMEFEQTLGDNEGQGSLACCCSWGHKELDMTEWLNNNKYIRRLCFHISSQLSISHLLSKLALFNRTFCWYGNVLNPCCPL